jgi:hypothetical protein
MTDSRATLIAALLDRTGSMSTSKEATEKGFNELINGQKSEPGDCLVTLAQFDRHANEPVPQWVYRNKPLAEVPPLVLEPRGMTPLLDATGQFVTQVGADLAGLPEDDRPGTVICVIMTDGAENASLDWTWERVSALIKQQQEQYNWHFIFLGANIDAVKVGAAMGVPMASAMTYNADDSQAVMDSYSSVGAGVSGLRSGMASAAAFSPEDRERAMGKKKATTSSGGKKK